MMEMFAVKYEIAVSVSLACDEFGLLIAMFKVMPMANFFLAYVLLDFIYTACILDTSMKFSQIK